MISLILLLIAASSGFLLLKLLRSPSLGSADQIPHLKFDADNSRHRYATDSEELIIKGYYKYLKHGRPFSIRNVVDDRRPLVLLPRKYLEEVKNAPEHELSFALFMEKLSILRDVGGPLITDELCYVMRVDLNRALPSLVQPMHKDCSAVCERLIPSCPDWFSIMPYPLLLEIFSRVTQCVLVGPELGRDREWLELTQLYTNSLLQGTNVVRARYHPSLRWLAKYLEPDIRIIYQQRQRAAQLLEPIIQARLKARREGRTQECEDAIEWLINEYQRKGKTPSAWNIAENLLGATVAAIHNTAATVLSTLYDLIDHPGTVEKIREEIRDVLERHGSFSHVALNSLRRLDSFMTESLRMHSMPQVTVQRLSLVARTFHDGFRIPAGTQIMFANRQLNKDPDVYPNPNTFDAMRFYHKQDTNPNMYHFASISDDSLNFGSGFHACPGRFFAQDVIKLLLATLLTRYEFKFGVEGQTRPKDLTDNLVVVPNFTVPIHIKELAF